MKKNIEELIDEINSAGRKKWTVTVIFHQTVAKKAGLSGSDHKYLDLFFQILNQSSSLEKELI